MLSLSPSLGVMDGAHRFQLHGVLGESECWADPQYGSFTLTGVCRRVCECEKICMQAHKGMQKSQSMAHTVSLGAQNCSCFIM